MKGFATLRTGGLQLRATVPADEREEIRNAVIPSVALFPLVQHTGAPAETLVEPGDRVREGMVIARSSGPISVPVHSSIPGVVLAPRSIRLPNGERSAAVVVKLEGEFDRLGKPPATQEDDSLVHGEELLERLKESGVVSLDDQAVPLHVLWRVPKGKRLDRLVVSAVNTEPLLAVEHRLSVERMGAFAEGLGLAVKILNPRRVTYVSEGPLGEERAELLRSLEKASAGTSFQAVTIGDRYPRGEHRELVRSVTGKKVAPGTSVLDLGIVVTNVSTLVAVRDALLGGKPLFERYITVAGGAISDPAVLRVRIGTPVRDLVEECGGLTMTPERIIAGGPLTGAVIYDLDTPIMKNTCAVLALSAREAGAGERAPCISCGRCLTACPEELNPTKLFNDIEHGRYEDALTAGLMDCTECGSCSFVCPSRIPLLHGMRLGKRIVRAEQGE